MKTYLLDIIPKIKRFSRKLDDLAVLTNQNWVVVDEETEEKIVFIFRDKENQLLISGNGKVEKGTWEYLGNNSILIDRESGSFLFKHGFIDDYILALKIDGKDEYALMVNEIKFEEKINSIVKILEFLEKKYLNHQDKTINIPKNKENKTFKQPEIVRKVLRNFEKSFRIEDFKELEKDILIISNLLNQTKKDNGADMIISFTRDHTIKSDWIKVNPTLADLVVKKKMPLTLIENIFKESSEFPEFRNEFEEYLRTNLE